MMWKSMLASLAIGTAMAPAIASADTVESVEGARAKERQGRWLNHEDRQQLRRWGSNDDYYSDYSYRRYDRGSYGYDDGPIRYYRPYPY